MRFNLFIAFRYLYKKKEDVFIRKIILISIWTVVLSVGIPITVISVINGLHSQIEDKILGSIFHLRLYSKTGGLTDYKKIVEDLQKKDQVEVAMPFRSADGIIEYRDRRRFV